MLNISSAGTSNAGQKSENEDNYYINGIFVAEGNARNGGVHIDAKRRNMQFYAVFDGIGEEVESAVNPNIRFHDGQSASFTAVHMLSKLQQHIIKLRKAGKPYNLNDVVYRYMQKTNQQLYMSMNKSDVRSGASFAFLCLDGIKICAYNMGNCKIFILREGRLNLLTKNDTKAEYLIYANQINPEIAQYDPANKILTQYLGLFPDEKQPELHINNRLTVRPGDKFLLCSDGLCEAVSDTRMLEIMQNDISEQETIRELIKEAELTGARDNITAVVVGVNISDSAAKVNKLRTRSSGTSVYFKPLPLSFRTKFNFSQKKLRLWAFCGVCIILAVTAMAILVNGLIGLFSDDSPPSTEPPAPTTPVRIITPTSTDQTETNTRFNITTGDDAVIIDSGDDIDPFDEPATPGAPDATIPVTTAEPAATAAPTAPPAPPTTAPPADTDAPVTDPPVTEPPTETEPPAVTEAPPAETEPPVTEPDTDPPVTDPPETDPPVITEPPPEIIITEEPTVAAEPPEVPEENNEVEDED